MPPSLEVSQGHGDVALRDVDSGHGALIGVLEVFSSLNGPVTLQCHAPAEHLMWEPSAHFALGSYR